MGHLAYARRVVELIATAMAALPLIGRAQIVADASAGMHRPRVMQTANGLPQVDIVRPSAAGVSLNRYTRFDVDRRGAILNNSPQVTATQQAGYVNGNANLLAGESARVIVNQVTSMQPSQLGGYLEVAGPRAEVVVANPHGIHVDGAGFLNTSRATLTTGVPVIAGTGSLDAFRVSGGQIAVDGAGLDATHVDQMDLIARAVRVNAALHANRLHVETKVDAGSGQAPVFGIDVSQLGGMYARKIVLASTEAGVGVSTHGVLAAHAGDFTLASNGRIDLGGQVHAAGAMIVGARDGISHDGLAAATSDLTISAASVASSGTLAAGAASDGSLGHAGNLSVHASGALMATGTYLAGGSGRFNGAGVSLAGSQASALGSIEVDAAGGRLDITGAKVRAARNLRIRGTLHGGGELQAGGDLRLDVTGDYVHDGTRRLIANGNLEVTTTGALINTATLVAGNQLTVQGAQVINRGAAAIIAGVGDVRLHAYDSVSNLDGATIHSLRNIGIARNGDRNGRGALVNPAQALHNSSATIEADGDIDVAMKEIVNRRTHIVTEPGTPVETRRQTLFAWFAGLPVGDATKSHRSISFPGWSWNGGRAAISADMMLALAKPVTVSVPKGNVRHLDTDARTISFVEPLTETYGPVYRPESRVITGNAIQHYQHLEEAGAAYAITFWPDWDPAVHIQPDTLRVRYDLGPGVHDYNETSRTSLTTTATDRLVSTTEAARIQALGTIRLDADGGSIVNQSSVMAAGGNLVRTARHGTIHDVGTVLQQTATTTDTSTFFWHRKLRHKSDTQIVTYPPTVQQRTVDALPAIVSANQSVRTAARDVSLMSRNGSGAEVTGHSSGGIVRTQAMDGAWPSRLPAHGLFTIQSHPADTYVVATDPRFTQYGKFISSDYMLAALGLDPQQAQKRIGDGFYEEKLVRDQITELTGRTFLASHTDQFDQYKTLMNNGVTYAHAFNLTPGVGLTGEQMARLTTDMVWMVAQDVTMPDGSTQSVLVPRVYLAQGRGVDLHASGVLVTGNLVSVNASQAMSNSGSVVGDVATLVLGGNIVNRGNIGGFTGTTVVQSAGDVHNAGGRIGGTDVIVTAGQDVTTTTLTQTTAHAAGQSSASRTSVAAQGTIEGTGNVAMMAGRDITMTGAAVSAGDLMLAAGRNIHLGTVALGTTADTHHGQSYSHDAVISPQGNDMSADGSLTAAAGHTMALTGTDIETGADMRLTAGQDLTVANAVERHTHAEASLGSKLSSYTQASHDQTVRASHLQAGGVAQLSADAGRLALLGSSLLAQGDVVLQAGSSVMLVAGQNIREARVEQQRSRSGVFGLDGNGFGIFVGRSESKSTSHTFEETQGDARSAVSATRGNVTIAAGRDVTIVGSDVTAGASGDIDIRASEISVAAGVDRIRQHETRSDRSHGISVRITGTPVDSWRSMLEQFRRDSKIAFARRLAKEIHRASTATAPQLAVSIGADKSHSSVSAEAVTNRPSALVSDESVNLHAGGGDLLARGVRIEGKNVTLTAARDINLESARDEMTHSSRQAGGNASVGLSLGLRSQTGFTVTASAARNQTRADNASVVHQNTHVEATDTLTLASGRDTILTGATTRGHAVIAHVGRNLNLESQQDIDTYTSRASSTGVQASLCVPPACAGTTVSANASATRGKTESVYHSVVEQTGMYAGDGGFNVQAENRTDLAGAVIASTGSADTNSLSSHTLVARELTNTAAYTSHTSTISGGTNENGAKVLGDMAGQLLSMAAPETGNTSGITHSAISPGSIVIRDATDASVALLHRDTSTANGGIGKIFDLEQIKAKQARDETVRKAVLRIAPTVYDKAGKVGDLLRDPPDSWKAVVEGFIGRKALTNPKERQAKERQAKE